jgi:hypothetical protein
MSRINPRPKQPTLARARLTNEIFEEIGIWWTYMQKKGEMRDESARARTEKYVAK